MSVLPKLQNIRGPRRKLGVFIDLLMLGITVLDLLWLGFDTAYSSKIIRQFIDAILPFNYGPIHDNFYFYDSIVVTFFIVEFFGRWVFSIYRKDYDKWFFYPFFHWYDVLGCIPTSSFRILRLLRMVGLLYRLDHWKVIDLQNFAIYNKFKEYYEILLEEVSDRVAIRVLLEAKNELTTGKPLLMTIANDIVKPKQKTIANMIVGLIQRGITEQYPQYQKILEKHISEVVKTEVSTNKEVKQFTRIPILGGQIEETLNTAVSQIVFGVVNQLIEDTAEAKHQQVLKLAINSLLDVLLAEPPTTDRALGNEIIEESIDLIISRVQVQQWKEAAKLRKLNLENEI